MTTKRRLGVAILIGGAVLVQATRSATAGDCAADLNGDGSVGPGDLAIVLGNWGPVGTPGPAPRLFSIAAGSDELAEVNLIDGSTISIVDVVAPGGVVYAGLGLAFNPADGLLYAILAWEDSGFDCPGKGDCFKPNGSPGCEDPFCCSVVCTIDPFCCESEWDDVCADTALAECDPPPSAPQGPNPTTTLATIDPDTGLATVIGSMSDDFVTIAFTPNGTLYAITGEDAADPESLYLIDASDASSQHVLTLGIGDEGESLAYRTADGLLYHASGLGQQNVAEFLETIDPDTLEVTPIDLSGEDYQLMQAMTYDPENDEFIVTDLAGGFYHMSPDGFISHDGFVDEWSKGLALITDFVPTNPADLNGDGIVGPADLAILLGNWGPCP